MIKHELYISKVGCYILSFNTKTSETQLKSCVYHIKEIYFIFYAYTSMLGDLQKCSIISRFSSLWQRVLFLLLSLSAVSDKACYTSFFFDSYIFFLCYFQIIFINQNNSNLSKSRSKIFIIKVHQNHILT